nr:hypothetical protein [Flaviflexus ciconiae]
MAGQGSPLEALFLQQLEKPSQQLTSYTPSPIFGQKRHGELGDLIIHEAIAGYLAGVHPAPDGTDDDAADLGNEAVVTAPTPVTDICSKLRKLKNRPRHRICGIFLMNSEIEKSLEQVLLGIGKSAKRHHGIHPASTSGATVIGLEEPLSL